MFVFTHQYLCPTYMGPWHLAIPFQLLLSLGSGGPCFLNGNKIVLCYFNVVLYTQSSESYTSAISSIRLDILLNGDD